MRKSVPYIILLSLMNLSLWAMVPPEEPTSCGKNLALGVLERVERPLFSYFLPKGRRFKPFSSDTQDVAQKLFANKNITTANARLTLLEEDAQLKAVATKARLGGLCLFLSKKKCSSSIQYDAYTASSVTQFMDGAIHHAIAIPEALYAKSDFEARPCIHGMIEREIARISQAYSSDDREVRKFWHNCRWACYSLAAVVALYIEPRSVIATAPGGLFLESLIWESTELDDESSLDREAAELAQTTDHLMATLTASTHTQHAQTEMQHAQNKYDDENSQGSLSIKAQRMLQLLIMQEQLKKDM